jgi:hypothetical protein
MYLPISNLLRFHTRGLTHAVVIHPLETRAEFEAKVSDSAIGTTGCMEALTSTYPFLASTNGRSALTRPSSLDLRCRNGSATLFCWVIKMR